MLNVYSPIPLFKINRSYNFIWIFIVHLKLLTSKKHTLFFNLCRNKISWFPPARSGLHYSIKHSLSAPWEGSQLMKGRQKFQNHLMTMHFIIAKILLNANIRIPYSFRPVALRGGVKECTWLLHCLSERGIVRMESRNIIRNREKILPFSFSFSLKLLYVSYFTLVLILNYWNIVHMNNSSTLNSMKL
jgi:hypothetical protein